MNRKILAVTLAAIMFVATLPATIALAQAQEGGVVPLTNVASPGSDVVFYINLTYLRNALGWVGSEIAIYLSGDGTAVISDNDLKIIPAANDFIYVAEDEYVAGTIRLPSANVLKDIVRYDNKTNTGYLYIKVTDGRNVAVSSRILVVFDTNAFITVKGTKLADPYGPLDTTNKFCFKVNLTTINQKLAVDGKDVNFSRTNITYYLYVKFVTSNSTLTAFYGEVQNNTISNITSDVFNVDTNGTYAITNTTTGETLFRFNGTLKDFALPNGTILEENLKGITVNAMPFNIVFTVETNVTVNLAGSVILIDNNEVVGKAPAGYQIPETPVSLGYNGTIEVYPSVVYMGYNESSTIPDQANPNDKVTLILKHFPANAMILITIYRLSGDSYEPLITINATDLYGAYTTTNGYASVTITIPEAPYGGLTYAFVATAGDVTGLPAINTTSNSVVNLPIYPYLEVYAFKDDGTPRYPAGGPTAWGDYLLVKGHGFLPEPVDLAAVSAATSAKIFDIIELAGLGSDNITVLANGTFIAIAKIPLDADNETFIVVGKGATPSDVGISTTTLYFELGEPTVQKVYVNPTPYIKNATHGYILLGLEPAYPFPAVWEDLANRMFSIEIIGFDPVDFKNVSINLTDGDIINMILEKGGEPLVNLTLTNGYLLIEDIEVPVIPYGDYYIKVYNSTAPGRYEMTYEPLVKIRPTAAFIDPLSGKYTTNLAIMAILDLNVTGYGWPAEVPMQWDIVEYKMLGFENFSIVKVIGTGEDKIVIPVLTNESGYFTGVVQLTQYISTLGLYHLQIHPKDQPDIKYILTLVINQAPQLIVNVETAKTKVAGDHVDIWIQVLFDGEAADDTQVPCVKVTVYAMVNGAPVVIVDGALAEFVKEGLWYYSFSIDPAYKGYDLAVVVKAKGSYLPYLPEKTAYDIATLTVAGGLQDQLDAIQEQAAAVAGDVAQLQEQVAALQTAIDAVSAKLNKLDDLSNKLDDVSSNVATANDKLDQLAAALNELSGKLDDLSSKMDQLQNNVQQTLDQFKTEVADTVGQASGTAKNWGIINAVLTILVLIVAIYLVTKKSP